MTLPRRSLLLIVLVAAALVPLAACSDDASTRASADGDAPTTTAAQVTVPESIPEGTVLRIGDQLEYLQTVLRISGEDQDLPYEVQYSAFVGGPPMLQAFQGGALDAGFVGSTPLIFAQAAGQQLQAVAGWSNETGLGGLITTDPSIEGWGDLKGKRVAYQRGTAAEAALLQALARDDLGLDDITTVDVPITQVTAAIKGGSADAGVSTEPLISNFIADTPGGKQVARSEEITDRSSFVIASTEALDDEARSAALADYISRLVRAFAYVSENRDELATSIYVEQYGLTPERATELAESTGVTRFISLPGDVLDQQQKLADLFFENGQIPTEVDVEQEFDTRFNDLVLQVQDEAVGADSTTTTTADGAGS